MRQLSPRSLGSQADRGRAPRRPSAIALGAALLFLAAIALGFGAPGCSLGNVAQDDCEKDSECVAAFGLGSKCADGFCSAPAKCATGHDCRAQAGGGACVDGKCVGELPIDAACKRNAEPPELVEGSTSLVGPDAPLLIGGIFSLDEPNDEGLTMAVRLAVREINRQGGLNNGRKIGVLFCDNGGPGNKATGAERDPLNKHALDYLSGVLGAPAIVGPLSSSDSLTLVNHIKEKGYPSVLISPSATSPDLTEIDDKIEETDPYGLFWRTCPSDLLQGLVLANDVIPAAQSLSVIYIKDPYGEGLAKVVLDSRPETSTTNLVPYDDAALADPAKLAGVIDDAVAKNADAVLLIALHAGQTVQILNALAGTPLGQKTFYFTDGSKDATRLLDPTLSAEVKAIVLAAKGTAPASPSGTDYELFATNLNAEFGIDPSDFAFLAQAYDAAYVGAYGIVFASRASDEYDGRNVAEGMANLSSGSTAVNVSPTSWNKAKGSLADGEPIDIEGTSGHLDFDAATGEAPGPIEVWGVDSNGMMFTTIDIIGD